MNHSVSVCLVSPMYCFLHRLHSIINQVRRFARHLLFDFSHFPSVVEVIPQKSVKFTDEFV